MLFGRDTNLHMSGPPHEKGDDTFAAMPTDIKQLHPPSCYC